MEPMKIRIDSITPTDRSYVVRATVVAPSATLAVRAYLSAKDVMNQEELHEEAYDEVLRYLDPL